MTTPSDSPAILTVGINGYARAGKNAAIVPLLDYGFTERYFKRPIVDFCLAMNPLLPDGRRFADVHEQVGYEQAKDTVPGFRQILMDVGLAGREKIGPDVWAAAALNGVDRGQLIVLADMRFPNEAQAVRDRRGVTVRIDRPGVGPALNDDGTPNDTDTALDDWHFDLRITNDGDLSQLQWALMLGLQQIADVRRARAAVVDDRDPECVKEWPGCVNGGYDPRCCRFPKSCSC